MYTFLNLTKFLYRFPSKFFRRIWAYICICMCVRACVRSFVRACEGVYTNINIKRNTLNMLLFTI